jgi:hypothetical protein
VKLLIMKNGGVMDVLAFWYLLRETPGDTGAGRGTFIHKLMKTELIQYERWGGDGYWP